ncbi:MAG TPA: class I SAM-dependent methyltransferase [Chitinophagaceae bacterium]|jgi:predicted O-methyltransferase YrrM|nr:class I SAM-dependent methyltransferase [Chitinophagaceae bacterium]
MTETLGQPFPAAYASIEADTRASGFTMASDVLTCSLLRTLAASRPGGRFLELGTGTGLSTSWILDGMDAQSLLVSVDNNERFLQVAREHLGHDPRLTLINADGGDWLERHSGETYDYIFADTWHGKYLMLEETLALLRPGGLYLLDDMLPQPNWPEGHAEKADRLVQDLEARTDLVLTKQAWATGIIIGVKKGM